MYRLASLLSNYVFITIFRYELIDHTLSEAATVEKLECVLARLLELLSEVLSYAPKSLRCVCTSS